MKLIDSMNITRGVSFWYALLAVSVVAYSVFNIIFNSGYILISGNIHDFLIPANAAYLVEQEGRIHEDMHSPFGYLYFTLNYASWSIISGVGGNISAIAMLTSVYFVLIVMIMFFVVRLVFRSGREVQLWFLVFVIALILAPRDYSESQHNVTWYGTYNRDLWGVIFLQIFIWLTLVDEKISSGINNVQIAALSVLSAICLALCFLYKISFFGASGVLVAATALLISGHFFRYAFFTTTAFVGLVSLPVLSGYSYEGYFQDLMMAINAKKENSASYELSSVLIFSLACLYLTRKFSIRPLNTLTVLSVLLCGIGVFLGIVGDFSQPYLFYFFILALLLYQEIPEKKLYRVMLALTLVIFSLIDIASISRIARYLDYQGKPTSRVTEIKVESEVNEAKFVVRKERYNKNSFTQWIVNTQSTFFDSTEEQLEHYWFYRSYGVERVQPPYDNFDYVNQLNDGIAVLDGLLTRDPELVIDAVEFTNPFPFFLGTPIPDGALHWVHPGTTVDKAALNTMDFFSADVVLLPVFSADVWRQEFNCSFYMFNSRSGNAYSPFKADSSWVYFIRSALLKEHSLTELPVFSESMGRIVEACGGDDDEH
jgi:hypothetical protein